MSARSVGGVTGATPTVKLLGVAAASCVPFFIRTVQLYVYVWQHEGFDRKT